MKPLNTRVKLFALQASAFLALIILGACARKVPDSVPASRGGGAPPSRPTPGWSAEKSTPEVDRQLGAAAYNKQGSLPQIHFETDQWNILLGDRQTLKKDAVWILAHPKFLVTVEGHCDERNTEAYNLALGERRATAAKEYLRGLGVLADNTHRFIWQIAAPLRCARRLLLETEPPRRVCASRHQMSGQR